MQQRQFDESYEAMARQHYKFKMESEQDGGNGSSMAQRGTTTAERQRWAEMQDWAAAEGTEQQTGNGEEGSGRVRASTERAAAGAAAEAAAQEGVSKVEKLHKKEG